MSAKIIYKKEEFEVPHGLTICAAIERLAIPSQAVIPTRNGDLAFEDEILQDGEIIKLVGIISGG